MLWSNRLYTLQRRALFSFCCLLIPAILLLGACSEDRLHSGASGSENALIEIVHDGAKRQAIFHPARASLAPLVLVMHGYGGNASDMQHWTKLDSIADLHGWAVAYPQGLEDERGMPHWNANLDWTDVDDIGFLDTLVSHLSGHHGIDESNVFACGFSNGGFMSYALACARPEAYRAIGSVAGTMSPEDAASCPPSAAVPVVQFSGLADETIPYSGEIDFPQFAGAPGMETVMATWAERHGLLDSATEQLSGFHPGWGEVVLHQYIALEDAQSPVQWYTFENGPHTWFERTSDNLVAFFKSHRKQ